MRQVRTWRVWATRDETFFACFEKARRFRFRASQRTLRIIEALTPQKRRKEMSSLPNPRIHLSRLSLGVALLCCLWEGVSAVGHWGPRLSPSHHTHPQHAHRHKEFLCLGNILLYLVINSRQAAAAAAAALVVHFSRSCLCISLYLLTTHHSRMKTKTTKPTSQSMCRPLRVRA